MKTDRGMHRSSDGYGNIQRQGIYGPSAMSRVRRLLATRPSIGGDLRREEFAGLKKCPPNDKLKIPGCTLLQPEVASVGLTEAIAKELGRDIRVGTVPVSGNGKGYCAWARPWGWSRPSSTRKPANSCRAPILVGAEGHRTDPRFVVANESGDPRVELDPHHLPAPTISETLKESVLDAMDGS